MVSSLIDFSKNGSFVAQSNAKGLNDWTALHMAAADGYLNISRILITKGDHTDIDARTSINRTALHLATIHNHLEVVKLLTGYNANINAVDIEFNTPLHYASMQGCLEIVKWLLRNDAKINILNNIGRTPAELALNYKILEVFDEYTKICGMELRKSAYGRLCIGTTLMHNSREDHINKLMFKASIKTRAEDLLTFNDRPKLVKLKQNLKKGIKDILPSIKVGPEDFKPLHLLGKGSFGEVYLVEKTDTKVKYAIKVLKKDKILGSNLIRYAFAERNILLNITHPFIVKLHYAFQTADKLAMVMEYCPNGDLSLHICKELKFSESKAKFYAIEVLLALEELHKHGIIFRDLKPDNVVLDKDGHARLTDFGLSKEGVYKGQMSKSFCGSVAYLAPEMLSRSGHSKTLDWYLLGVLIFEMLVGKPPFFSSNREQLFANIQNAQLVIPNHVSKPAKDVIKLLMNRNPAKRLGASNRDAEEIKNHEFFKGVKWQDYFNKLIPPPPFQPVQRASRNILLSNIFVEESKQERLEGWSVLVPGD